MKSYKPTALEKGRYYHIYNRGNNGIDIFFDVDSYYHFLRLYDKYITPIAETFAWCLLNIIWRNLRPNMLMRKLLTSLKKRQKRCQFRLSNQWED